MERITLKLFLRSLVVVMKMVRSGSEKCPFVGFLFQQSCRGLVKVE